MVTPTPNPVASDDERMPYPVAAAGLLALLALTLTAGLLPMIPVLAVGIIASYFVPARLEGETFNRWWVRLILLFMIILLSQSETSNSDYAIGGARTRNILAQVYMAEFAVQCWRRSGNPVRSRLIALVVSGLAMIAAANTFDDHFIRFVAPAYILSVGLALYTHRARRISFGTVAARVAALLVAVSIGGAGYITVEANRSRITELGNKLMGERFNNVESTGMAASPQLGEVFNLRGSTARILRIENFTGNAHLRGMAFDTYSQGRWSPPYPDRRYRTTSESELNPPDTARMPVVTMRITRLVGDNPLLYAPLEMARLSVGEATDVEWARDSGGPLRTRTAPPYTYEVSVPEAEAKRDTYQGLLANKLEAADRARYLQVPTGNFDPRVEAIAKRITAGAKTDKDKVEAVVNYLISNYSYSLRFQPGRGEPLVNFLTAEPKRPAHCEYFASASALLLRLVGVPTRYCTGYLANESDGPNTTVVRQRDAHAWSEAWVAGVGWVTVEATPGDGQPGADKTPVEWWRKIWEAIQDGTQAFAEFLAGLSTEQIALIIGIVLAGVVAYTVRVVRKRQMARAIAAFAYAPPEPSLAELIVRFERLFAKRGSPFPPQTPYRDHLTKTAADPESKALPLLDAARQFVNLYDALRFGNRQSKESSAALRRLIEEMEKK